MNLFFIVSNCLLLSETRRLPPIRNRNNSQPEGRQAKYVNHRTGYEGAGGPVEISGNWVSPLIQTD